MANDSRFPAPDFQISGGEKDGMPVVAVINTALAGYPHRQDFPWLIELKIHATTVNELGLPNDEDVDLFNQIEQTLHEQVFAKDAHFVARQVWKGRRMLDFYVADRDAIKKRFNAVGRKSPWPLPVTWHDISDPQWTLWTQVLEDMAQAKEELDDQPRYDQAVIIRIPLSDDEFGTDSERDAVWALCEKIEAILDRKQTGEFDGEEFGQGEATIYCYGNDAPALFRSIEKTLRAAAIAKRAVVTLQFGPAGDESTREETITL